MISIIIFLFSLWYTYSYNIWCSIPLFFVVIFHYWMNDRLIKVRKRGEYLIDWEPQKWAEIYYNIEKQNRMERYLWIYVIPTS